MQQKNDFSSRELKKEYLNGSTLERVYKPLAPLW